MREFINIVEAQQLAELSGIKGSQELAAVHDVLDPMPATLNNFSRRNMMREFLNRLGEMGYTKLGAGSFGAVFTHPGIDYAIKIIKDDPAFLSFVHYCLAHKDNPYLPKFRGKFMRIDDRYFAVRVELLSDNLNNRDYKVIEMLDHLSREHETMANFVRRIQKEAKVPGANQAAAKYLLDNPKLITTVVHLTQSRGTNDMDLVPPNFMKRDGTLVVIDPYIAAMKLS